MKKKIFFKTVNLIFIVIFLSKNSPKNYITKIKKEKRKKKKVDQFICFRGHSGINNIPVEVLIRVVGGDAI
jgi:orotate phosphoribosyltransferase-like protein